MNESRMRSIDRVRGFLRGTIDVQFRLPAGAPQERDRARYALISEVARGSGDRRLRRRDNGLILRYLQRLTGYSAVLVERLVS